MIAEKKKKENETNLDYAIDIDAPKTERYKRSASSILELTNFGG